MSKKSMLWSAALLAGFVCLGLAAAPVAVADDVEIKIELPEPFFGGTPIDYWSPNLEPEDFKDRPPFMAPEGTALVSKDKPVTSSEAPLHGKLTQITDGDKDYARSSTVEIPGDLQWVQIDLEEEKEIYALVVWHFHEGKRVYFDIVVQASNDKEFSDGVTTIYNNDHDNSSGLGVGEDKEYQENYQGRLMDAKGVSARYVRLYSSGNTADDFNHYVEVEVYGK
ncbi:MAG TPA: discoidin domain-containing protein [Candidatus Hydrogenedentes bacterium]|jgi:hypothetical protein|nr:discoidin domain-containing protein [Candidatus Hydrogenedentota bacterium]HOM48952.1 discoidin domain-containing protein [Candidatus Hydrogenedentota bacterium]HOR50629.1 discoidin domain-containing protein [Candidatus Hydrogenedentota bacterium]HPX85216.1 discoidin domain-containing protein [Candidatus Hydrogenedentota bacterium]HQB02450.1 discoidin domain-containing protein [Candidatus Hydrogenedentota bacterium]